MTPVKLDEIVNEQEIKLKIRQKIAMFFRKVGKKLKLVREDTSSMSASSWGFAEPEAPFVASDDDEDNGTRLNRSIRSK